MYIYEKNIIAQLEYIIEPYADVFVNKKASLKSKRNREMGVITRQRKYIEAVMRAGEYQFKDKSSTKCVAELTELFKVKDIERFYTLPMQCKAWTCEQKEKYPHFFEWIEEFYNCACHDQGLIDRVCIIILNIHDSCGFDCELDKRGLKLLEKLHERTKRFATES